MRRYRLSSDARTDIKGIWNYTFDRWGKKQADSYVTNIFRCFDNIVAGDCLYKQIFYDSTKIQYVRYVRCEHHYIFFLSEKEPIFLAILHEKMDFISVL